MHIFAPRVFIVMKKRVFNITKEGVRGVIRQALSPTFLIILFGSALSWYASNLSNEYTTEIPLGIRIDGEKYRLTAEVSGRGSAILGQRLSLKRKLNFSIDDLSPRQSRTTLGAFTIPRPSLQNAINSEISGLRIVQVTDAPDFMPPDVEVEKPLEAEAAAADTSEEVAAETPRERRQRERRERREARKAARAAETEVERTTE